MWLLVPPRQGKVSGEKVVPFILSKQTYEQIKNFHKHRQASGVNSPTFLGVGIGCILQCGCEAKSLTFVE